MNLFILPGALYPWEKELKKVPSNLKSEMSLEEETAISEKIKSTWSI